MFRIGDRVKIKLCDITTACCHLIDRRKDEYCHGQIISEPYKGHHTHDHIRIKIDEQERIADVPQLTRDNTKFENLKRKLCSE